MSSPTYDVAIVGFGPTGAVAAGLLAMQGLRVFVCDRSPAVYEAPRAFALDHEIMRVFQQLGVADAVMEHAEPFTPSEFYGVDGQLIKRFSTVEPPYPLAHPPSLVFTQPPVERILRARVQSLLGTEVALGWQLSGLVQHTDGVDLRLRDAQGQGPERTVSARYVVGCDGASSTVRGAVGIALQDLGFDQPWLVVDVLVDAQALAKLPQTSVQFCEPERPCTFLIGPGNHRRWEISINPGEDPKAVATPEGTWKLLSRWLTPQDGRLWRQASYRFHALVAERWRVGRVFVAGDAAHQQPPFLGQGMCQGIRDAANLAWKLGAVLRDAAPEALLDSYGEERKAHVTELTTRIKGIGQLVGERDVQKARARDAQLLAACDGVVKSVPRQDVQPALQGGLLSPSPHAARGTLFPQPWVMQGAVRQRLDEVTGRSWRLVLSPQAAAWDVAALPWMVRVVVGSPQAGALQECDGVLAAWWARMGAQAAIVRPDHHVYAAVADAPALAQALTDLTSRLSSHP